MKPGIIRKATAFALACDMAEVTAKLSRWASDARESRWTPAKETLGIVMEIAAMGPQPTAPARLREEPSGSLDRRDSVSVGTNTCAFVNGLSSQAVSCGVSSDVCVYNSDISVVGCCPSSSTGCPLTTTCFPRSSSLSFTEANGHTLYCSDTTAPNCATLLYADAPGLTLFLCAGAAGTEIAYLSATDTSTSISSSSVSTTTTDPASKSGATNTATATSTTTGSSTTSTASASATPSNPTISTGAAVGLTVGSLLALIALLFVLWLCYRRRQKRKQKKKAKDAARAARKKRNHTHGFGFGHHHHHHDDPSEKIITPDRSPPVSSGGGLGIYHASGGRYEYDEAGSYHELDSRRGPQRAYSPDGYAHTHGNSRPERARSRDRSSVGTFPTINVYIDPPAGTYSVYTERR